MAILIAANVLIGRLNVSIDLTPEKKYSLSTETLSMLKNVDEKVTIYALFAENSANQDIDTIKKLLSQYETGSSNITVSFKDPSLYPTFMEKYESGDEAISPDSVIVESDKRFRVIKSYELIVPQIDYQTYTQYVVIDAESQITNAISYVSEAETTNVYVLSGHNEVSIPDNIIKKIELANYSFLELNLLLNGAIPEDCNLLLISTPQRDWTSAETSILKEYLQNGGRALIFMDIVNYNLTNLNSVLSEYGAGVNNAILVEGSQRNYYPGSSPINLIPVLGSHEITSSLEEKQMLTLIPLALGIDELSTKKETTLFEPLLTTTESAYGKTDPNPTSINKEQFDIDGPFNVAVAITEQGNEKTTKLVVVGSSSILDENVNEAIAGGNVEFIINSMNWTQDKADRIYITPKSQTPNTLTINQQQAVTIMVLSVVVLPAVIIGIGVFVWFRRKNS